MASRFDSKNEYEAGSYSNSSFAPSSYTANQSTTVVESDGQQEQLAATGSSTVTFNGLTANSNQVITHVGGSYANGSFGIGSYVYTGLSLDSQALALYNSAAMESVGNYSQTNANEVGSGSSALLTTTLATQSSDTDYYNGPEGTTPGGATSTATVTIFSPTLDLQDVDKNGLTTAAAPTEPLLLDDGGDSIAEDRMDSMSDTDAMSPLGLDQSEPLGLLPASAVSPADVGIGVTAMISGAQGMAIKRGGGHDLDDEPAAGRPACGRHVDGDGTGGQPGWGGGVRSGSGEFVRGDDADAVLAGKHGQRAQRRRRVVQCVRSDVAADPTAGGGGGASSSAGISQFANVYYVVVG